MRTMLLCCDDTLQAVACRARVLLQRQLEKGRALAPAPQRVLKQLVQVQLLSLGKQATLPLRLYLVLPQVAPTLPALMPLQLQHPSSA